MFEKHEKYFRSTKNISGILKRTYLVHVLEAGVTGHTLVVGQLVVVTLSNLQRRRRLVVTSYNRLVTLLCLQSGFSS